MDYQLAIATPSHPTEYRTVTGNTPTELAQAAHRHVRGLLHAQVDIHLDGLTGTAHRNGVPAADITLTPAPPAAETPGPDHGAGIRWGWTLANLDDTVRRAINRTHQYRACDADERYAAGWHAAVELLYTTTTPPRPQDLYCAAWRAADSLTTHTAVQRGVARSRGTAYTGRDDLPRWHAYWETVARHTASPEEPILERTALAQIWPRLTPGQQTALSALAAHDDYQAAADALNLSRQTFYRRITSARAQVLALWWEGETPRRGWRDRRATSEPAQLHSVSAHVRKRRRAGVAA